MGHQLAPVHTKELAAHAGHILLVEVRETDDATDQQEQNGEFRIHQGRLCPVRHFLVTRIAVQKAFQS